MKEYFFANYRLVADDGIEQYEIPEQMKEFEAEMPYTHTFRLHFGKPEDYEKEYKYARRFPVVYELDSFYICKTENSWAFFSCGDFYDDPYLLLCSEDYGEMELCTPASSYHDTHKPELPVRLLLRYVIESAVVSRAGLSLHASMVEKDGMGIIFLAPSGTGKSTQAKLWRKYLDADFVSGDRPCLRFLDGKWYVSGMPWDGKDLLFRQKSVPVRAMITISQAKDNRITPQNGEQTFAMLMNQVMIPTWDGKSCEEEITLFESLMMGVSFYSLGCRPDQEAVEMVYQLLKKEDRRIGKKMKLKGKYIVKDLPGVSVAVRTDDGSCTYYTLNRQESFVFRKLLEEVSEEALISSLSAKFDFGRKEAEELINDMLSVLRADDSLEK